MNPHMNRAMTAHLDTTRAILGPDMSVTLKTVTDSFYAELNQEFNGSRQHVLVSRFSFSEAWETWECHPEGDEIVIMESGDTDLVLWRDGKEELVRVSEPGAFVVVPKGVWHTARPHMPTTMVFVTPGEGTENRAAPPAV